MKETKRRMEFFPFYDRTGIAKHLEKMASEGWLLEKISTFTWTYKRIEPTKMHFAVSYYATLTDFEPEPTEEQQAFNEFCEHSGWKFAASSMHMQIFYNENDDPTPIETDPVLEIEDIHKKIKKTIFPSFFLLFFYGFLMGGSFIGTLLANPIHLLSSATKMFTGIWSVVAFAYALIEITSYYTWRKKALKMAEQGVFLETRGHRRLGYAIFVFMIVSLVFYLISLGNTGFRFYMTAFVLIFFSGFAVVNGVKGLLKKRKVAAGTNRSLTFLASFALAFLLMGAVNVIAIHSIRNGVFDDGYGDLPIKMEDLLEIDTTKYLQSHGTEDSIFLGSDQSNQHPLENSPGPSMSYTVIEVKMPALYDFVVNQLHRQNTKQSTYGAEFEYSEINAQEWHANMAWELYRDGKPTNQYLICYDKHILEIEINWVLTTEQKQSISASIFK